MLDLLALSRRSRTGTRGGPLPNAGCLTRELESQLLHPGPRRGCRRPRAPRGDPTSHQARNHPWLAFRMMFSAPTGTGAVAPKPAVDLESIGSFSEWPGNLGLAPGHRSVEDGIRAREGHMQATVGDQIKVHGHRTGQPDRGGEVREVRGPAGGPPYLVRWSDTDHETLFFPGPDATVQHPGHLST